MIKLYRRSLSKLEARNIIPRGEASSLRLADVAGAVLKSRAGTTTVLIVVTVLVTVLSLTAGAQDVGVDVMAQPDTMGDLTNVAVSNAPWLTLAAVAVREISLFFKDWAKVRASDLEIEKRRADLHESRREVAELARAKAEATLSAAGWKQDANGNWSSPERERDPR